MTHHLYRALIVIGDTKIKEWK